jgi:hypothetical protein
MGDSLVVDVLPQRDLVEKAYGAVARPQGWMATVLNLIMNGVTVFMVVDEEEVFESTNKQTKGFLFASPSGILSPVLPLLNHSFPPTGIFHLRYEWEFSYSGQWTKPIK